MVKSGDRVNTLYRYILKGRCIPDGIHKGILYEGWSTREVLKGIGQKYWSVMKKGTYDRRQVSG